MIRNAAAEWPSQPPVPPLARPSSRAVDWHTSARPVAYADALAAMEARVAAIASGDKPELVWLLEHPPLYTAGTSAEPGDLLEPRFPVLETGRGGQIHLSRPRPARRLCDARSEARAARISAASCSRAGRMAHRHPRAFRRRGRAARRPDRRLGERPEQRRRIVEDKIAAVGVRVRRWITYHGVSLNVAPELSHYSGIVPCGVAILHSRGHEPRGSRDQGDDGRGRPGAARRVSEVFGKRLKRLPTV